MSEFEECVPAVCHSAELPYVFRAEAFLDVLNASWTDEEELLSQAMNAYWARFVTSGRPSASASGHGAANNTWHPFDAAMERSMRFLVSGGEVSTEVEAASRAKCAGLWDDLGYDW